MENLKKVLESLKLDSRDEIITKFDVYRARIIEKNQYINLTNITDPLEFEIKHFIDSVIVADYPEMLSAKLLIDVGTGAGFPGVPLALIFPEKEITLMDSLQKRLKIIDEILDEINVKNAKTVHARAEELGHDQMYREKFDICVSRAVANLSVLAEYCLPFIKVGGYLIAYKGPDAENEVEEARKAVKILGGKVEEIRNADLDEFDIHHKLVMIKKVSATPKKYPRKAGTPSKTPIR